MGNTFDKVKEGFKKATDKVENTAEKVTDSDTYTGTNDEKRFNTNNEGQFNENPAGGKEPMNPEDIAEHEPTAVKRDKNQGTSGDPV